MPAYQLEQLIFVSMEKVVKGLVIRQLVAAVREALPFTLASLQHRQVQVPAVAAAVADSCFLRVQSNTHISDNTHA
jgi:hypothetical protein